MRRSSWPFPSPWWKPLLIAATMWGCGDETAAVLEGGPSWRLDDEIGSVLRVAWDQPYEAVGRVEYRFDDEEWISTPEEVVPAGPAERLVLGVPYETALTLRVVADAALDVVTEGVEAETGPIPDGMILPVLGTSDPTAYEPAGRFLLGSINADPGGWNPGRYWVFLLDRQGRLVWARPGEGQHFTLQVQVSVDHDILQDVSTFWTLFDGGEGSWVQRMGLDGRVTAEIPTPGLYHPFAEGPDGSLYWASPGNFSSSLHRLWPDLVSETIWNTEESIPGGGPLTARTINSIFYDEDTDRLLLAFPTGTPLVVDFDLATSEPLRWFGDVDGGWDVTPADAALVLPHAASWTDTGTLLLADQVDGTNEEGVVREYALDEEDEVLRLVFGHGQGQGIEAHLGGWAARLPGGNTLHGFGTTPRIQEVTPEGEVVWDVAWEGEHLLGRLTWLDDLYALAP